MAVGSGEEEPREVALAVGLVDVLAVEVVGGHAGAAVAAEVVGSEGEQLAVAVDELVGARVEEARDPGVGVEQEDAACGSAVGPGDDVGRGEVAFAGCDGL